MSENLERVQLSAEEEELISGGMLDYYQYRDGWHITSPKDPNTVYTFVNPTKDNIIYIKKYEKMNCFDWDDQDIINFFLSQNWIKPM